MRVKFETRWQVSGTGSLVVARLSSLSVQGVPAGVLRGMLLGHIRDSVGNEAGVQVDEDSICVNLAEAAAAHGATLTIYLTNMRCSLGCLTLEASKPN
jgi:hypothetical protein